MIAVKNAVFVAPIYNLKEYTTASGKKFIKFTIRTWEPGKDGDKVEFFNAVAYASAADIIQKHFFDGKIMYLDCKISSYKNKDGINTVEFVVNQFSFVGNKEEVA